MGKKVFKVSDNEISKQKPPAFARGLLLLSSDYLAGTTETVTLAMTP